MDAQKLENEMKRHNISKQRLCKDLNISRSAFYRKCKGVSEFTESEIQAIVDYLGIKSPLGIFFNDNVS